MKLDYVNVTLGEIISKGFECEYLEPKDGQKIWRKIENDSLLDDSKDYCIKRSLSNLGCIFASGNIKYMDSYFVNKFYKGVESFKLIDVSLEEPSYCIIEIDGIKMKQTEECNILKKIKEFVSHSKL